MSHRLNLTMYVAISALNICCIQLVICRNKFANTVALFLRRKKSIKLWQYQITREDIFLKNIVLTCMNFNILTQNLNKYINISMFWDLNEKTP